MKPSHDWPTWKIEECCDILDSKRVPINSEERERRIGDIPYYGANGQQGYIDDFIFDEPLILVAEDGGRFDEFSTRPIAYRIAGKSWVNNHAHVLRARYGFSQDAIFYTLEHKDIQPFIVGGTRTKLNQSVLRSITIQLPERESEQTKIAEILSTVDQAIDQTEALIAKKQRIKTGLMQDLLTRGIDENGNLRSEETHEFKGSPLGRIPVEWDVRNINSMSDFVTSGARGWAQYYGDEGAVFLRIGNLTRDHINMRFDDTVFVSSGGNTELDQRSDIAIQILSKVFKGIEILILKDRDMMSGKSADESDRDLYLSNNPPNHRVLKRLEIENYLFDKEILLRYCESEGLTFNEADYDNFVTDINNQNVKDEISHIKNCCGIQSSINREQFKLNVSKFITEETVVYQELRECIFDENK